MQWQKKLIKENKLIGYYFAKRHNNISPALVLVFNDCKHHIMPIRKYRWHEYMEILDNAEEVKNNS